VRLPLAQRSDDVAERQQPFVDLHALREPVARRARPLGALGAGQVDEVEPGREQLAISQPQLQAHREDGVRP
jgi:hypothetical protein